MNENDFIIGNVYRFCDPAYPEWVGHTMRVTSVDALVRGVTIKPPSGYIDSYPPGTPVAHAYGDLEPVRYSPVAAMFE